MKSLSLLTLILFAGIAASAQDKDSANEYKKRVLDNTEVDYLMSMYHQNGDHSAVGGGIGSEKLSDATPTIVVSVPLNDDDVLTIDAGISAYTSASSSNINPFNSSGASRGGGEDDDDEREHGFFSPGITNSQPKGTPWLASSGASRSDELISTHVDFSHSSNSRNFIWGANSSVSNEFDYTSFGFGGNIAGLFNQKNTEISLKSNIYLDQWRPIYPTELHEYNLYGNNFLSRGYFQGVNVLDQNGRISSGYHPADFTAISRRARNSYSASLFLSQIFSKRLDGALFFDLIKQEGLLSTPYHRIYFADKPNYYIGQANYIQDYTTPQNRGVYQLADDIERLPSTRFKIPVGVRLNYYVNETFIMRTYYRYYTDDWGLKAHTANFELPVRFGAKFSVTPSYRFYTQNAAKYYAPYETHVSSEQFYTSDPDLAKFTSNQYSMASELQRYFQRF